MYTKSYIYIKLHIFYIPSRGIDRAAGKRDRVEGGMGMGMGKRTGKVAAGEEGDTDTARHIHTGPH